MWALTLLLAPPASASCATDSPEPSPHAFLGTVIATSEDDRVAEVITDDEGARVTVQGTDETGWLSRSHSSVDRRYSLGGRYEFHPLDGDSPYSDNACTASRQLSGPPPSASQDVGRDDAALVTLGLAALLRRASRRPRRGGVPSHPR